MPERFHQVQYEIAGCLAALCILLYAFAPEARSDGILGLAASLVGFCIGKFSNGYKRPSNGNGAAPTNGNGNGEV